MPTSKRNKVCHITTVHVAKDTRIFQKECVSLAKHGWEVHLIVANQDSDTIAVFSFNLTSGEIKYSGNEYRVPSPNFICSCPISDRDGGDEDVLEKVGNRIHLPEEDNTSTIPTSVEIDHSKKAVESELEIAKKEIAELKKQISSMTVTAED